MMSKNLHPSADFARYVRQTRYAPLGEEGQRRLAAGRVLVCGCGALGCVLADTLVRAGVGVVRIVDRDYVEVVNLQRQTLFDEEDARRRRPKAVAAAERLRRINSDVKIEPIVFDVQPDNVEKLCEGVDLIVDGTDNFETRLLINDVAVKHGLPWVHGGCLGAEGRSMTIVPGRTPCLRCLIEECPPPGTVPGVETAGILGPIVGVIASIQAIEAIKILSGNVDRISTDLTVVELWANRIRRIDLRSLRDRVDCPTCKRRVFPSLTGTG